MKVNDGGAKGLLPKVCVEKINLYPATPMRTWS